MSVSQAEPGWDESGGISGRRSYGSVHAKNNRRLGGRERGFLSRGGTATVSSLATTSSSHLHIAPLNHKRIAPGYRVNNQASETIVNSRIICLTGSAHCAHFQPEPMVVVMCARYSGLSC